jgi:hypothetical protein
MPILKTCCLALLAIPALGSIFQPPVPYHSVELAQWTADEGGNNHFYEVVESPAGINWDDAAAYAAGHGGYLATITSPQENTFVFKLVDDAEFWSNSPRGDSWGPWLGGVKAQSGEGWDWGHGEGAFNYTNWAQNEPDDDSGHANHLHFFGAGRDNRQPQWDDLSGSQTLPGFIVEYDTQPLPKSLGYIALFSVCLTGLLFLATLVFLFVRKRLRAKATPDAAG